MKTPSFHAIGRFAPRFVANFDSASAMVRALAHHLRGTGFPRLGMMPPGAEPVMAGVNRLPCKAREEVYTWSGWAEAIPARRLGRVRVERIHEWVARQYPRRNYPAVAVGASNGAAIHLCAALGVPWLPQTFLVPVRRHGSHPDEPRQDLAWGRRHAPALLDANPDVQLHHMHDPNQDRLMIRHMTYFRVKRRRLGPAYERFLTQRLPRGGTLLVLECERTWPTTRVADRHRFQFGAMGGAPPEEYHEGSDRVAAYLRRYGSYRTRWDPPAPDGTSPEAEWGFEPALREDVARIARERGYRVLRLRFREPEDLSPLVADVYRARYRGRGLRANRLVVDSFILMDPWWTLRVGAVPFWTKFPVEPDARALEAYLDGTAAYDDAHAFLFSHGVDSVGLARPARWLEVLRRARNGRSLLGVDAEAFPRDFATFSRYHDALRRIPARYPLPGPLSLADFEAFLDAHGDRYDVDVHVEDATGDSPMPSPERSQPPPTT